MTPDISKKTNTAITIIAVVLAALLLNAIFSQVYLRADLTSDKLYTLSDVSHQAAAGLDEPVEVRAFISDDLPPPYHRLDQRVDELLAEYEAASGGMVRYDIIRPDGGDDLRELARGYGIRPVTIGQRTDTEQSFREVYKGVAFVQGPNQQSIPDLQASARAEHDDFEYEFTRALLQLHRDEPRTIGVLTGAGGPATWPGFIERFQQVFADTYGQLVELTAVDVQQLPGLADSAVDALIAININESIGDDGIAAIDGYLAGGGSIGWFQNGAVVDEHKFREALESAHLQGMNQPPVPPRTTVDTDLHRYFAELGFRVGNNIVIDRDLAMSHGVVPTSRGPSPANHPGLFPVGDIVHDLPFARHFSTLFVPAPTAVDVDPTALKSDVEPIAVLTTSETSVRLGEIPEQLLYDHLLTPFDNERQGAHPIAVAAQGPLARNSDADSSDHGRVLVMGSGDFIREVNEVGYGGELTSLGIQFFLSSTEWLAQQDQLADIRGKSMPALVAEVPQPAQRAIQLINIIVVPALFAALGIVMFFRRRRRKEELSTPAEA